MGCLCFENNQPVCDSQEQGAIALATVSIVSRHVIYLTSYPGDGTVCS